MSWSVLAPGFDRVSAAVIIITIHQHSADSSGIPLVRCCIIIYYNMGTMTIGVCDETL